MPVSEGFLVLLGAIGLGLVHGAEPGHGWPIAATYALDRENKWWHGFLASSLLGIGHLISSLAVVGLFFLAKRSLDVTALNDPMWVFGYPIGGPVGVGAGLLLVLLGIREYRHGHGHGDDHDHSHDHDHGDGHDHSHGHEPGKGHGQGDTYNHGPDEGSGGLRSRVRDRLPLVGSSHEHPTPNDLDSKGLLGIVWTAFVLGFVHEEEFEIIGLCMGSTQCLGLMVSYAIAVLVALVGLTLLLIAGYYRYRERIEHLSGYFPAISAAILIVMGVGFILGLL